MKKGRGLGIVELILGILLILLGLFTFLHPSSVLGGIAAVYGAIALITGIADIVFYAKMERRTGFGPVVSLVTGILSVIAGILILFNLSAGAWLVATLFPIWFLAHCISRLAQLPFTRMTSGSAAFWFSLVLNILGLVLGVLLLANPVLSILSSGWIIGAYLIALGMDSLFYALSLLSNRL